MNNSFPSFTQHINRPSGPMGPEGPAEVYKGFLCFQGNTEMFPNFQVVASCFLRNSPPLTLKIKPLSVKSAKLHFQNMCVPQFTSKPNFHSPSLISPIPTILPSSFSLHSEARKTSNKVTPFYLLHRPK